MSQWYTRRIGSSCLLPYILHHKNWNREKLLKKFQIYQWTWMQLLSILQPPSCKQYKWTTHIWQSLTCMSNKCLPTEKSWLKMLLRNRDKFYLSATVCQLSLWSSHLLTWVVNYGLLSEGTLKYPATLIWVSVNKSILKMYNVFECFILWSIETKETKWPENLKLLFYWLLKKVTCIFG